MTPHYSSLSSPKGTPAYWTPLPAETNSQGLYCDYFASFLRTVIRCHENPSAVYRIPLSSKQKDTLTLLIAALRGGEDIIQPLQEFLFVLCEEQPSRRDLETWTCPMQCFWPLLALRPDGNFITPDQFTGWLTKSKHLCIMTAALDAVKHVSEYPNGMIG